MELITTGTLNHQDLDPGQVIYHKLSTDRFDIRLLRVRPGAEEEPISCTLSRYQEGADDWSCLSYTWGSEPASETIAVNGAHFMVRPNLLEFLKEARRRKMTSPLWIDSICIHQNNVFERASQVASMSTIFRNADCVIAWLGRGDANIARAFEAIDSGFVSDSQNMSVAVAVHIFGNVTFDECNALFALCGHDFWTRLWIKQELLLPRRPTLWCGSGSLPLASFFAAIDALVDYFSIHKHQPSVAMSSNTAREPGPDSQQETVTRCHFDSLDFNAGRMHCMHVLALAALRKHWKRRSFGMDLPSLLETFKYSTCMDFHDSIYAFRGLLHGGKSLHVSYEYSSADMLRYALDFTAQNSNPRIFGGDAPQRNLLRNLYEGLRMTYRDLEDVVGSATRTLLLVQCGESLELGRKQVKAWRIADAVSDVSAFASEAWRSDHTCSACYNHLTTVYVSLNQLPQDLHDRRENFWLYGLQAERDSDLNSLFAAYNPGPLYDCSDDLYQRVEQMHDLKFPLMALAFRPQRRKLANLDHWLADVRDHFVVTVSDSDDMANALWFSVLPTCNSSECLLKDTTDNSISAGTDTVST